MEKAVIEKTERLNTKDTIKKDLQALGVKKGMTLLVHSRLSSIGWVCGAEQAVIEALQEVLTTEGTLIMPAHSGHLSDPKDWCNPPVPEDWWETIRMMMPAFDKELTPTSGIGKIPEIFRTYPNVLRSNHPQTSFCAWGKHAEMITENHPLSFSLGVNSPLEKIYNLDGDVLFIGTNYDTHTSFHLSEYAQVGFEIQVVAAPIVENDVRVWKTFHELAYDTDLFPTIGRAFEESYPVKTGMIGQATCRLFKQRASVDFGRAFYKNKTRGEQG
ncbi:MAG: aminoglycoside N(3)-acetyltransferase [Bacillaceae bacterium]